MGAVGQQGVENLACGNSSRFEALNLQPFWVSFYFASENLTSTIKL